MVNLELYRIFVIVANEGNISKASEILHISQPAISKQIHNLENELNITLFERSNTGVKLTIDGNKLYFFWNEKHYSIKNFLKRFNKIL